MSRARKPADAAVPALLDDTDLRKVLQEAIDSTNAAVSQAESIRRWRVLPEDFTIEGGEMTPTLKVRRSTVVTQYAEEVEELYR